jgi:hypothetical protein
MLFQVVPFTALGGVPEPYGPAPTWGGVAPGGYSRGPETYWKGAYWQPEEPSPYTNPGESHLSYAGAHLSYRRRARHLTGCVLLVTGAVPSVLSAVWLNVSSLSCGGVSAGINHFMWCAIGAWPAASNGHCLHRLDVAGLGMPTCACAA